MIKLLGIVLIICSFAVTGNKLAKRKRARLDYMENMLSALSEFCCAIKFFSLPIPKAMEKSGIEVILKSGIYENLSSEDKKDLDIFLKGLKSETLSGQLVNIEAYEKKLKKEELDEREKYKKEAKLIKGGFLLIGFLAVIILM